MTQPCVVANADATPDRESRMSELTRLAGILGKVKSEVKVGLTNQAEFARL